MLWVRSPIALLLLLHFIAEIAAGRRQTNGSEIGTYTFRLEFGNHILARHTTSVEGSEGPATFDCDHGDLQYVYQDAPGQALKAIHFDNEGHVIHYNVSAPNATTAIFLSDASNPGPQFRLIYEMEDAMMLGRFQMRGCISEPSFQPDIRSGHDPPRRSRSAPRSPPA